MNECIHDEETAPTTATGPEIHLLTTISPSAGEVSRYVMAATPNGVIVDANLFADLMYKGRDDNPGAGVARAPIPQELGKLQNPRHFYKQMPDDCQWYVQLRFLTEDEYGDIGHLSNTAVRIHNHDG